jgi:hypothetical protein
MGIRALDTCQWSQASGCGEEGGALARRSSPLEIQFALQSPTFNTKDALPMADINVGRNEVSPAAGAPDGIKGNSQN